MERALLIVNPAARGGRSAEAEAVAGCAAAGVVVRIARTAVPGDAARIAAADTSGEPILVLGGDGTVAEVVGATVGRGIAVGILPGGTGNQLARHLGIPLDIGLAARALAAAVPVGFDLGRLGDGRYFAVAAGLGLDAAIMAGASLSAKRRFGVGAYVWSAVRALRRARDFPVRIEADGKVFERGARLAIIANMGSVMGGRLSLGPRVRPDDGWLDVCVLSPRGLVDAIGMAAQLALHSLREGPRVLLVRARRIRISAPTGTAAEADGELLRGSTLDAEVVPRGATFLAPPSS